MRGHTVSAEPSGHTSCFTIISGSVKIQQLVNTNKTSKKQEHINKTKENRCLANVWH